MNNEVIDSRTAQRTKLQRLDLWANQFSDRLNPILIKETRQSLKSRQFIFTFFSLLTAALGWTIVGSLSRMPQIYTTPSAPTLLLGYYAVLAVPMLLVVPLAAYRSLEVEIDDGTLELLSISSLSPWQVVLGKLASSLLQIFLYFIVLLPCMAYAYTLRGVNLTSILLITTTLLASGIFLTIFSVFFASLTHTRSGRTLTLLGTVIILLASVAGISLAMSSLILDGNLLSPNELFFSIASCLFIGPCAGHLMLTATAIRLTPESENRSTPLRRSVLALSTSIIFASALATLLLSARVTRTTILSQPDFLYGLMLAGGTLWTIAGSMFVSESPNLTPRVKRDLPSSIFHRSFSTWLTPGPATGFFFVCINAFLMVAWFGFGLKWLAATNLSVDEFAIVSKRLAWAFELSSTFAAYLVITLIFVGYLVRFIRKKQNPRIEIGIASLIATTIMMALIPYSIGLHLNEFRTYAYSNWQMSNWIWTLSWIYQGNDPGSVPFLVKLIAILILVISLIRNRKVTRPTRTATPQRVLDEKQKKRPNHAGELD